MNQKQLDFLVEKFLNSLDYDQKDGFKETSFNERKSLEFNEQHQSGNILKALGRSMLDAIFDRIEGRLIENCGYRAIEFLHNPLIDKFEKIK